LKVLEFNSDNFKAFKLLENDPSPSKVLERREYVVEFAWDCYRKFMPALKSYFNPF